MILNDVTIMKKQLILSALAILAMASCSQDEIAEVNTSDAISFNVATTRGTEVTIANLDTIYVVAITADGGRHLNNVAYIKQAETNVFKSKEPNYWPQGNAEVKFYISNVSFADSRYIDSTKLNTATPTVAFKLPGVVDTLPDLLTAYASGKKSTAMASGIPITLSHRFAQIQFRAKEDNAELDFEIRGIRIYNVNSKSELVLGETPSWTELDGTDTLLVATNATTVPLIDTARSLMSAKGNVFLPPVARDAWNPTGDKSNSSKGTYLALDLTITKKVGDETVQIFPDEDDQSVGVQRFACIPFEFDWTAGKRYVYTLDFTKGAGYVNPTKPNPLPADPYRPGDLILGGEIRFSVEEMEEWDDGDPHWVDMDGGKDTVYGDYNYTGGEDAPNGPYVLYFDTEDDNRLSIGKWGTDISATTNMALAQFGSVVGLSIGTYSDPWDAGDVKFSPTSATYSTYTSIPVYVAADYNAGNRNVSAVAYHTGANIKAGKGDICKLAGLTSAEAQAMSVEALANYDSDWRLPTNAENGTFVGTASSITSTTFSTYANWNAKGGTASLTNPPTVTFKQNPYYNADTNPVAIPAAGFRATGSMNYHGEYGIYWSSTANSDTQGNYLHFNNSTISQSYYPLTYGNTIRCVYDPQP
jgi:hypothetical protein